MISERTSDGVLSVNMYPVSHWIPQVTHGHIDTRVRATWRGIVPWVVGFGAQITALAVAQFVIQNVVDVSELGRESVLLLGIALFGIASGLGLFVAIRLGKWLDEQLLSDYGVEISASELMDWVAGIVIGGLTYAAPTVLFLQLGEADITAVFMTQVDNLNIVALATVAAIVSFGFQTAFEEFAFRGVMLQNFAEGVSAQRNSPHLAAVVSLTTSSVIFGVSHIITQGGGGAEGRSLQIVITSSLLGLLWGGAYILTGQLAIPFGLHLGHNLWAAVVLQPTEVALSVPALGQVRIRQADTN